jgi:hypothetical protein
MIQYAQTHVTNSSHPSKKWKYNISQTRTHTQEVWPGPWRATIFSRYRTERSFLNHTIVLQHMCEVWDLLSKNQLVFTCPRCVYAWAPFSSVQLHHQQCRYGKQTQGSFFLNRTQVKMTRHAPGRGRTFGLLLRTYTLPYLFRRPLTQARCSFKLSPCTFLHPCRFRTSPRHGNTRAGNVSVRQLWTAASEFPKRGSATHQTNGKKWKSYDFKAWILPFSVIFCGVIDGSSMRAACQWRTHRTQYCRQTHPRKSYIRLWI